MLRRRIRFCAMVTILALATMLTACANQQVQAPINSPEGDNPSRDFVQLLNDKRITDILNLFDEEATLIKENPCLEYFDETRFYTYRQLDYGQLFVLQGKPAIKEYLQNLFATGFRFDVNQFRNNGDSVSWQGQILLEHASVQAVFQAVYNFENGKIRALTITYSDLTNLF